MRRSIRAAIRGLWTGDLFLFGFTEAMRGAIERGLTRAWHEGAAQCGIKPSDMTDDEVSALRILINTQIQHVLPFGETIQQNSRDQGGKLGPLLDRGEIWVNRYNEVRNRGQQMACTDLKTRWDYGDTIDHCEDCRKVEGRVYRNSVWAKYGWVPGSRSLACGGWRCDCKQTPTDESVTPGRPPALSGGS